MQRVKRVVKAGAGTGKTKLLIDNALGLVDEGKVLYLTYTTNNLKSMKQDIVKREGLISSKIICRTWQEFLYNDLAKPYRKMIGIPEIKGLDFRQLGEIPRVKGVTSDSLSYYMNINNELYSQRLAQFCLKSNEATDYKVFHRIPKIYKTILIDEIQDLNGHDLDILKILYELDCNIIMVGDNRQATYSTNNSPKYSRYAGDKIFDFFKEEMGIENIENLELCYRCNQRICDFANGLFEDLNLISHHSEDIPEGDGIILLESIEDMTDHINTYKPAILYYSKPSLRKLEGLHINHLPEKMSFGDSKGLTRDRVLIIPTADMKKHALGKTYSLASLTLAKYYVGITRARFSVALYTGK